MPRPTPALRQTVDRTTAAFAVLTVAAFGLAATARAAVTWATAGTGAPVRYRSVPPAVSGTFDAADAVAAIAACAAGAGVLLLAATLVLAVRRHRAPGLPYVLASATLAMVVGAVVAGSAAGVQRDAEAATGLVILRTALAGLAAASLPALVLAAARARSTR
ncbi:hypothetical protein ACTJKO_10615 [Curtobacterium sp. 22159]|uniref:hypothetical protein n=1 Tax=Curtobacterium sp. 22159 TaxID=3453882 RepID=UPI003F855100